MILRSLQLQNIRSYSNEKVSFPQGITLFEGDIGSGKSTILMAIEFSLFGIGNNSGNSMLKVNEENGFTKLEFSVDDNTYEICRKLKRKNNTVSQSGGYIIEGKNKTNLSTTELKKRVIQILKFNESSENRSYSRIFRYAIYTPQEEMKKILSDSERRLETIRKAFELDAYKNAILNSELIARQLDKISARLETSAKNLEKNETMYFSTQKLIAEKHKVLNELVKNINDLENKKKSIEKKLLKSKNSENMFIKLKEEQKYIFENINRIEKEIGKRNKEISIFENQIKSNNEKIKKLKTINKPTKMSSKQINKKIDDYRKNEELYNNAKLEIEKMNSRLETLSKILGKNTKLTPEIVSENIKKLKKQSSIEKKQLDIEEENRSDFQKIKTELEVEIKEIEKKLKKFMNLNFECPTCEQKVDKKYVQEIKNELNKTSELNKKNLQNIISKIKINEKTIIELRSNLEKIADTVKNLISCEPLLKEYLQIEENIEENKNQNNLLEKKIKIENKTGLNDPIKYYLDLNSQLQIYNKAQFDLKQITDKNHEIRINVLTSEKNIRGLNKELNSNTQYKNKLEKQITSLKDIRKDVERNSKLLSDIEQEYILINKKSASIEAEKDIHQKRLREIKDDIIICEKAKSKYDRCNNFHEWLKGVFVPILDIMETKIMQYLQHDFNNIYQNWYSILVDDPSKESRIDEDFTPIIEQEGYDMDTEHLSGGEKTSIALAYRLTLNSMLRRETESLKSNILILDEPTYGFSKSQLSKVKSILTELNSEQIILVSHERELEGYAQNIFQVTKDKGLSKITKLN